MTDKGEPFFSVEKLLPPLGRKVRVIWQTRKGVTAPFDCVRWIKNGRTYWTTVYLNETVHLPTRRDPERLTTWDNFQHLKGMAPLYWAPPLPAHTWPLPLPEADFHWREPPPEERMNSSRQEFSAADEAHESEMIELGFMPRRQKGERPNRVAWQWWRNEHAIVWDQEPNKLTLRDCEGRLMRAIALSNAGRVGRNGNSMTSEAWENTTDEAIRYIGELANESVPFTGANCDIGEAFLEAMRWFTSLGPDNPGWRLRDMSREQKILIWRSLPMPLSYAEIGELLGEKIPGKVKKTKPLSGARVRQIEKEAIEKAWRVGAGIRSTMADAQIEALRERNRRIKRNSLDTA